MERAPVATAATIGTAVPRVVESANAARDAGDANWWRALEAALAAVGAQAEAIAEVVQDEAEAGKPSPIDVERLLTGVVPALLRLRECPFLQGRAFVFASQFARLFPPALGAQYLDAAAQVVEAPEAGVPVKISAIKAIQKCAALAPSAWPWLTRAAASHRRWIIRSCASSRPGSSATSARSCSRRLRTRFCSCSRR
jgi:hypothetical protein